MPTPSDPLHLETRLLILAELLEKTAAEAQRLANELRADYRPSVPDLPGEADDQT